MRRAILISVLALALPGAATDPWTRSSKMIWLTQFVSVMPGWEDKVDTIGTWYRSAASLIVSIVLLPERTSTASTCSWTASFARAISAWAALL